MSVRIFEKHMKDRLRRDDDKQLFEELYKVYLDGGKEELTKYLNDLISQLEG